jgi:hypothetical protein
MLSYSAAALSMNSKVSLIAVSFPSMITYCQVIWADTYLVVCIKPIVCLVGDSYGFPVIDDLSAGTIYDVTNFVGHYKFQILMT